MPKVSEEHMAARRRQILDAALTCFARDGFHQTPMQAVFEEAGLSPGAVYRYFAGKEEIVGAIAAEAFGTLGQTLGELEAEPPTSLGAMAERLLDTADGLGDQRRRLAVQVWGESLHNPGVAEFVQGVVRGLLARVAAAVRAAQERGALPSGLDPEQAGRVVVAIVQGYVIQSAWDPALDGAAYRRAARLLLAPASAPAP